VHELNITNDKLASAKQQLMQSEKLAHMGQLSAGIAHELNNPLGVITMYANLLFDEFPEDDPRRHDLELIVEQTGRCRKIVGGLLNFARKNQVNLSDVDAVELTLRSIESVVKPSNISIQFHPHLSHPVISLDADQMMQVLTNLVKNAIEAMPEIGGEIIIELTDSPSEINFIISDTGTGILKENLDKIFTPFFTTKEVGKGTGLGLPLIYGIVKMHKGKISVHSNANPDEGSTGTTFTISLPKHQ
jgi:signal transduction histidine kinase